MKRNNISLLTGKKVKPKASLKQGQSPLTTKIQFSLTRGEFQSLAATIEWEVRTTAMKKTAGGLAILRAVVKFVVDCDRKSNKTGALSVDFEVAVFVHEILAETEETFLNDLYMDLNRCIVNYDEEYLR